MCNKSSVIINLSEHQKNNRFLFRRCLNFWCLKLFTWRRIERKTRTHHIGSSSLHRKVKATFVHLVCWLLSIFISNIYFYHRYKKRCFLHTGKAMNKLLDIEASHGEKSEIKMWLRKQKRKASSSCSSFSALWISSLSDCCSRDLEWWENQNHSWREASGSCSDSLYVGDGLMRISMTALASVAFVAHMSWCRHRAEVSRLTLPTLHRRGECCRVFCTEIWRWVLDPCEMRRWPSMTVCCPTRALYAALRDSTRTSCAPGFLKVS